MREIKFRIFEDNKMHYPEQYKENKFGNYFIDLNGELRYYQNCYDGGFFDTKNAKIMQFTGLHDKNGKEIYEEDIVSKETFDDTKPNYRNISYAKVVWIKELASYHLVNKDDKILWDLASDKYNIEVAGNIYENSDLLKGADNI